MANVELLQIVKLSDFGLLSKTEEIQNGPEYFILTLQKRGKATLHPLS